MWQVTLLGEADRKLLDTFASLFPGIYSRRTHHTKGKASDNDQDIIYRCYCGRLYYLSGNYLPSRQLSSTSECDCGSLRSLIESDLEYGRRLNKAIDLLPTKGVNGIIELLKDMVPVQGPVVIDMGIDYLTYYMMLGRSAFCLKDGREIEVLSVVHNLIHNAKGANQIEYYALLAWVRGHKAAVVSQLLNVEIAEILKSIKPDLATSVQALPQSYRHRLTVDAYGKLYEISFYFELFLNLIQIAKGNPFSSSPFTERAIGGKSVVNRGGRLIKGLALQVLRSEAPPELRGFLDVAYDSDIRNYLVGHNDYSVDELSREFVSLDGVNHWSFDRIEEAYEVIKLIHSALFFATSLEFYAIEASSGAMFGANAFRYFGLMDWWPLQVDGKTVGLAVSQYFANFLLRLNSSEPIQLHFMEFPWSGYENRVCVGIGPLIIHPYELRTFASPETINFLRWVEQQETIDIEISSVAPPVLPFRVAGIGMANLHGIDMVVMDKQLIRGVSIDRNSLTRIIAQLEKINWTSPNQLPY